MHPYFSIIIPVYNGELYLRDTLDSLLIQQYDNFEVLVIDDGSTDNTAKIVRGYQADGKISIRYYYKENGGVSSARNFGMDKAEGEYIAFLDCDDLLEKQYLQSMHRHLQNGDFVWANCINTENGYLYENWFTYDGRQDYLRHILSGGKLPQTACWILKRSVLWESELKFIESISFTEDYNFFCKWLAYVQTRGLNGIYFPEALVNYRIRTNSLSQRERYCLDLKHIQNDLDSTWDIYDYVGRIQIRANYGYIILCRLKKKYVYNAWNTLLLGKMKDFYSIRRLYTDNKMKYDFVSVKLDMKYRIWEFAIMPGICFLARCLSPYKRARIILRRKRLDAFKK